MSEAHSRHGGRAQKFAPDVLAAIPAWMDMGASREEIAEVLGTSVGSLQVTCTRAGISLRVSPRVSAVQNNLGSAYWAGLRREAERRGVTVAQLFVGIIAAVVDHDLFSAVLGDYDDLGTVE